MTTATLTSTDEHLLARMEGAGTDERDEVFADLAQQVEAGSVLAARTIRQLLLPTCSRIAAGRSDEFFVAVVDAAYDEVLDWARTR